MFAYVVQIYTSPWSVIPHEGKPEGKRTTYYVKTNQGCWNLLKAGGPNGAAKLGGGQFGGGGEVGGGKLGLKVGSFKQK